MKPTDCNRTRTHNHLVCKYFFRYMFACSSAKQVLDSNTLAVSEILDIAPVLNKRYFEIQAIAEYRLILSAYVTWGQKK